MRRLPNYSIEIERRTFNIHEKVRLDMQALRNKWITELDSLFETANAIAKGKVSQQQVGDKLQQITPKERQMWAQITTSVGMVMSNLSRGYDERQWNEDFAEVERLLNEVKKLRENCTQNCPQSQNSATLTKSENTEVSN